MRVICEMRLTSFEFWAGAKYNAQRLTYEELEQIGYILEDVYSEGIEDTTINDLFWFDFGCVVDWLGYKYDVENDLIIREKEEDDEE